MADSTPPKGVKPLNRLIAELNYGNFNPLVDAALADVVNAVREQRKVGKLTITLDFKPMEGDQVQIVGDVKTTLPRPKVPSTIMFFSDREGVATQDPRQRSIEGLQEVGGTNTAPREVPQVQTLRTA